MTDQHAVNVVLLTIAPALGFNMLFWSLIGLLRLATEGLRSPSTGVARMKVADIAVVIPAHNEESALPHCLAALLRIVSPEQIYVASDGSKDATVSIARGAGCNAIDIQPNGGKARALQRAVAEYDLCNRYRAVLIQDADSEIDPEYFVNALPLLDDPNVVVIAGHVRSRWPRGRHGWRMLFTAYRTRLYRLVQMTFQFGQSWRRTGVSYIAPGFASMYRTTALRQIDIVAPGLVIEDFNMTFEVQHKRLGRIAYTPLARCSCEDPLGVGDYVRQLRRWYLGFWQTVWRHGFWPGKFWAALLPFLLELMFLCLLVLALPIMVAAHFLIGTGTFALTSNFDVEPVPAIYLLGVFVGVDYAVTLFVAILERKPSLLVYGLVFPLLRILEAALFLLAFGRSFVVRSDGRWRSPARHNPLPYASAVEATNPASKEVPKWI